MNWAKGLLRLWLVGSLLWAVPVGWLTWPGDAPLEYLRYWYYRVAHSEVLGELRANDAAAAKKWDAAWPDIRARYDATRLAEPKELPLIDATEVRAQISRCWNVPEGARNAKDLAIEIRVAVDQDGTVRQATIVDQMPLGSDPFFHAVAESARRAFFSPLCRPLHLPSEKYAIWKEMVLDFAPGAMTRVIPDGPSTGPHEVKLDELVLRDLYKTEFTHPGSEQLEEFRILERDLETNRERVGWWATYTFLPPGAVLIIGTSLL
jgi:hypothetical protein